MNQLDSLKDGTLKGELKYSLAAGAYIITSPATILIEKGNFLLDKGLEKLFK